MDHSFEFSNLLAGGAVIGLLAGFWDKIKALAWRVVNLVVQQVEVPSPAAHRALVAYLVETFPRSRFYDKMFGAYYEHHRDGRLGLVPFEEFGNRTMVFWNGWWPFVFANVQENKAKLRRMANAAVDEHTARVQSTVTFLRGTIDVEAILRESCARQNHLAWEASGDELHCRSRFTIHQVPPRSDDDESDSSGLPWYRQKAYRLLAHDPEQLGKAPICNGSALANLVFPRHVRMLIREIELWRKNRQWYRDRAIPWKRGWLLHGPPGTGKTALARAFAEDLNMPIYVYHLAELGNPDLLRYWSEMQRSVPCIALLEDIDNVFHGRENIARKNQPQPMIIQTHPPADHDEDDRPRGPTTPLTFDCLLNCLDGVDRADGIFTIITTNDLSKVDAALGQPRTMPDGTVEFISTRPGRIDKAVELGYMERSEKRELARRILADNPAEFRKMLEFIDRYADLQETPAQFQERCSQIALKSFWNRVDQPAQLTPQVVDADLPAGSPCACSCHTARERTDRNDHTACIECNSNLRV